MPRFKHLPLLVLMPLLLSTAAARAQAPAVEVTTDRPEALYSCGEPVTFRIHAGEKDRDPSGETVKYVILRNGITQISSGAVRLGDAPAEVRSSLSEPGFLRCDVRYQSDATTRPVTALAGAGYEPEKIRPSMPVPDDFNEFWDEQKKLLSENPAEATLTPVDSQDPQIEAFDVQVSCPAPGNNVSGYMARPRGAEPRSLPAILYPHSAGVHDSDLSHAVRGAKLGLIALDFNAHGLPNGKGAQFYKDQYPNGPFKGYAYRGVESREECYFRGMYLRLLRALDFLTQQPEWDGRILIVEGSSQGGGQALVAAGLDHRITLCLASVPALCDLTADAAGRESGWPKMLKYTAETADHDKATQAVRYVDAMNFASRISCPTYISVGFIDKTCPPTSVYAAFNNIPPGVEKHIVNRPEMGHRFPPDLVEQWNQVILKHIANQRGAE
jgi:cephalosporin-C deacetylase-like acetyl esterase